MVKANLFKVIAHRANLDPGTNMDNSLNAIKELERYDNLIDTFEVDGSYTKDGVVVLTHEDSVKTISFPLPVTTEKNFGFKEHLVRVEHTSNKRDDRKVNEIDSEELLSTEYTDIQYYYKWHGVTNLFYTFPYFDEARKANSFYKAKLQNNDYISTLEDTLKYMAENKVQTTMLYELKERNMTRECAYESARVINDYKGHVNIEAQGYNAALMAILQERTGIRCGKLINHTMGKELKRESLRNFPFEFVSSIHLFANPRNIENCIEEGKDIAFWTCDLPRPVRKIISALETVERTHGYNLEESLHNNVGIITNVPLYILGVIYQETIKKSLKK